MVDGGGGPGVGCNEGGGRGRGETISGKLRDGSGLRRGAAESGRERVSRRSRLLAARGQPATAAGWGDIAAVSGERLREALRLIGETGSAGDVEEYKRFALAVAQAAAEAHKEGGFIGIGGKQLSAEEQAAFDEMRGILAAARQ
jgi:hypothetical protein